MNRLDLRTMLRRKLEDTGGSPLWDDATLNDALAQAVSEYGVRFPAHVTESVAVTAGDRVIPLADSPGVLRVVQVVDSTGAIVEPSRSNLKSGIGERQSWSWWDGMVRLSSGAIGGNWEIDYLGRRELPNDDVTTVDIPGGDEDIVVLMAASAALMRRSVEQGKRGLVQAAAAFSSVADAHTMKADRLISSRRRRVVGGWMSGGQ